MALRTQESLQKLFEASKLRNEKKKQEEQLKYKKAQESTKKALAKQQSKKQEKTPQKDRKQPQIKFSRTLRIYHTKYIERDTADDDLYTTREELKEAEKRGEGKLNWKLLDKLIEETKKNVRE